MGGKKRVSGGKKGVRGKRGCQGKKRVSGTLFFPANYPMKGKLVSGTVSFSQSWKEYLTPFPS
jgi:hypothetical protein